MKGIVFTEFLELVEQSFGLEMVDRIIQQSELKSQGVYTAVGTYEFAEMLALLGNLSSNTGIDRDQLLKIYGEFFFKTLQDNYGSLLNQYKDPIDLLASIENHIHVEVRKIYPDAELPTFEVQEKTSDHLVLIYKSSRAMHHFGLGLMNKAFDHFGMKGSINLEKLKDDGTEMRFVINKING